MSELMKKIELATRLKEEADDAQKNLMMKAGMCEDTIKEICQSEFGMPVDTKEVSIPFMLKKAYMAGYKDAKAEA